MQIEKFEYRKILKRTLSERKMRNPLYSMRSFARDLDISVTALSQVLSCKRDFSLKNMKKVSKQLCWSPAQIEQVLDLIKPHMRNSERDEKILELQEDMFSLISEWYYLAILTIAKQPNAMARPDLLAEKLGIKPGLVETALERLVRLKLIEIIDDKLIRTSESIRTGLDIPSASIRKYHTQNLNLAQHSLENVPLELREVSSMTMNIDPEQMEMAKKMIIDFKRKFTKVMEKGEPQDAYTLAIHFFPATLSKDTRQ